MSDRVVIYVPGSREWYRREGLGLTPSRQHAHRYTRAAAQRLIGTDSQVEIQESPESIQMGPAQSVHQGPKT
jgi:hypothetical protein